MGERRKVKGKRGKIIKGKERVCDVGGAPRRGATLLTVGGA